jgi:hypothetical protein
LWAQIHGLISLYLEGQNLTYHSRRYELKQILTHALNRFTLLPLQ